MFNKIFWQREIVVVSKNIGIKNMYENTPV